MIAALLLLMSLAVSALFVAAKTDHDCCHVHCSICAGLSVCRDLLHVKGVKATALTAAAVFAMILAAACTRERPAFAVFTPVDLNDRMND